MKFNKLIPNQTKELLKNQIKSARDEISNSSLKCKDFIIALLQEMYKVCR